MNNYFAFVQAIDNAITRFLNIDCSSALMDYCMIFITNLGNGLILSFLMALIIYFNPSTGGKNLRRNLTMAAIALISSGLVVTMIKELVDRPRPLEHLKDLRAVYEILRWRSFPSGHSAAGFAAAVFLSNRIKNYRVVFYGLAALVAVSRVYLAVHYPSDIIVGSIIGVVVSITVLKIEKTRKSEQFRPV